MPSETTGAGIVIRNISKTFAGTAALRGLDLHLVPGEVHALLGANGSGKSTLVKILSGYQDADPGGGIYVDGAPLQPASPRAAHDAGLRFVHQDLALVPGLSVADNILLTSGWPTRFGVIDRPRAHAETRAALGQLGADIAPETLVSSLSPAMKTVVAMTRAVRRDPASRQRIRALVLDEPTATLPQHEVAVLARIIREVARQGTAVLLISHHLQEALDLADVVTVMRDGHHVLTSPAASTSRRGVVAAMMGEELVEQTRAAAAAGPGAVLLRCRGLGGPSFVDVSLSVRAGEIVGIAGLEGSGRDDLLAAIFGAGDRYAGNVSVAGVDLPGRNVRASFEGGLAYVPADRARWAALPELTGRENLTIADLGAWSRWGRVDRRRERAAASDWFDRVDVRPRGATERRLADFSGGNQQKVIVARCLSVRPRVLLLDEPTQGIDVAAQANLHATLVDTAHKDGTGILLSSSDEEELAAVCHRVLIMRRGRVVGELAGDTATPKAIADRIAQAETEEPV